MYSPIYPPFKEFIDYSSYNVSSFHFLFHYPSINPISAAQVAGQACQELIRSCERRTDGPLLFVDPEPGTSEELLGD